MIRRRLVPIFLTKLQHVCRLLHNMAFRLRLASGTRIVCPMSFVICHMIKDGRSSKTFLCEVDNTHPLAGWLIESCPGPWRIIAPSLSTGMNTHIAFGHVEDAIVFRIL